MPSISRFLGSLLLIVTLLPIFGAEMIWVPAAADDDPKEISNVATTSDLVMSAVSRELIEGNFWLNKVVPGEKSEEAETHAHTDQAPLNSDSAGSPEAGAIPDDHVSKGLQKRREYTAQDYRCYNKNKKQCKGPWNISLWDAKQKACACITRELGLPEGFGPGPRKGAKHRHVIPSRETTSATKPGSNHVPQDLQKRREFTGKDYQCFKKDFDWCIWPWSISIWDAKRKSCACVQRPQGWPPGGSWDTKLTEHRHLIPSGEPISAAEPNPNAQQPDICPKDKPKKPCKNDGVEMNRWDDTLQECGCYYVTPAKRCRRRPCKVIETRAVGTSSEELIRRLLPPVGRLPQVSYDEWTAMSTTLYIIEDQIKTQQEFHQVCDGDKNPTFGFQLAVFQRLCNPDISIPIPASETRAANRRISSAYFAMTLLKQNNGDYGKACKSLDRQDKSQFWVFDKAYIVGLLCL